MQSSSFFCQQRCFVNFALMKIFDIYPTAQYTILYCSSGTEHSFANKWPILMGLAAVCACLNLDNDEDMCIYKVSFFGVEPYLYGYKILHGL